ncbi:SchA/CurD-like domain-containing protein [Micromonospora sp. NPDC050397]|uniref:SchA/CurD-like domain-containing protein n=1 Tax=Micromonospora sp. NPDC050397 TaxID=3364279 RepID=UPI00384D7B10
MASSWHALHYPLKARSEEKVKELFRMSGRPQFQIYGDDGRLVGRLLSTMAFVGREMAVRVIEVEGPLGLVATHISRQDTIREFEQELQEHLAVPRDMTTPQGARDFFRSASMECVLTRRHDR